MISIIIPIYNSESLLNGCIESIVGQDYRDWELLLIDDGSTDGSSDIGRRWEKADSRVKYFQKENGGVSSARNYGLDRAAGDYIMFVDSDDFCASTILLDLSVAIRENLDMAACDVLRFKEGDIIPPSAPTIRDNIQVLAGIDKIYRHMDHAGHLHPPFAKLYRQEIIRKHAIHFDESLSLGEDLLFNLDYLQWVRTCAFIPAALYYYHDTDFSLSKTIRADYADIQLRLIDSKLEFIKVNRLDFDYCDVAPGIVRDMFLSLCRSDGSNACKTESIKRIRKHPIMKMAWKGARLSDTILLSAISFIPVKILLKIIR